MNSLHMLFIAAFTLISEDGAAITAAAMVSDGQLVRWEALVAVFIGIWLGDLGLLYLGRWLRPLAQRWHWAQERLNDPRLIKAAGWLDRRGWQAIFISRLIPASRLPTYLAAGMLGMRASRFALWTALAIAAWTPLIVLGAHLVIDQFWSAWAAYVGNPVVAGGLILFGAWGSIWSLRQVISQQNRQKWRWRWRKRHHEWWPIGLLYVPVGLFIGLCAIRYRSWRAPLAANPGLLDSGVVGESKAALQRLAPQVPWLTWTLLAPGPAKHSRQRLVHLQAWIKQCDTNYPIILKPDVGERGGGVSLVRNNADALRYLSYHPHATLAQMYHPGPVEIGVFWSRCPGESGRILAITDKHFPILTGDGHSSLGQLIDKHPRFRLQRDVFRRRWSDQLGHIVAAGETFCLGTAGNHCQGCLFTDGAALATPALNKQVNRWMRGQQQLNFGRFDVRAASYDDIRAGRDLAVIEMNGLSSEPTGLYDPDLSWFAAMRMFARCWNQAFRIGRRQLLRTPAPRTRTPFALWRDARKIVSGNN